MAVLIDAQNDLLGYLRLIKYVNENGVRSSRYKEVLNCILSIDFNEGDYHKFLDFKEIYLSCLHLTSNACWARAERVYTTFIDRLTKPSYLKRMRAYDERIRGEMVEIDQIEQIVYELASKPNHSLLSFTIFRPADLVEKKRPGYVPCPIAGDFKFRHGKLHLTVFFRSHDALNFGYPDIHHLRLLQRHVLYESQGITNNESLANGKLGTLNLHFSRAYIPLRMEMVKGVYINKPAIDGMIEKLLNAAKTYISGVDVLEIQAESEIQHL